MDNRIFERKEIVIMSLIQIHMIQNHAPSNLNRDDLGSPKTCFFGNVLRLRISSQCLKRSIRMSNEFSKLRGGIRTRRLAELIAEGMGKNVAKEVEKALEKAGISPRAQRQKAEDEEVRAEESKMLVFTTKEAIEEIRSLLTEAAEKDLDATRIAHDLAKIISQRTAVPDMALFGRMLEPTEPWENLNTTVEAAAQVAHAISTHEAHPEIDYYVAADDIPGKDQGAAFLDEAMFGSACYYKYFSISWESLLENLSGFQGNQEHLAAHTVGAFIRAAALTTPTGKQNSFAAFNPPELIMVEFRNYPLSYANAFVNPIRPTDTDLVSRSIMQFVKYVKDLDSGYGKPEHRFWFSPNLRHRFASGTAEDDGGVVSVPSLDQLVGEVIKAINPELSWDQVRNTFVTEEI
ncbi:MAG: type I-E CRISPR-associated protein Cas7/Cse4/CasC [bacterium]